MKLKVFYEEDGWGWKETEYVVPNNLLVAGPYYCQVSGDIYVSERLGPIADLIRDAGKTPELNTDVLYEYFAFRYVAGEDTLVKKVRRLPPGKILGVKNEKPFIGQYFDWAGLSGARPIYSSGPDEAMVMLLEAKLRDRLNYLKNYYYPAGSVAFMLSGGVDSSLLVALAGKWQKTISVVFDGFERDEQQYSQMVADRYSESHHKIMMSQKDFRNWYPRAVIANGEPISYPNTVAMLYMAHSARDIGVRYLVNGEGADEIFAGYKFYLSEPDIFKSAYNNVQMISSILDDGDDAQTAGKWRWDRFGMNPFGGVNREIYYNMNTYLFPVVNRLVKTLTAAGIAPISPFFDMDMLQFSLCLPDRLKVSKGVTKVLIKKLAEKYFDHDFVHRDKIGFSLPIDKWLRDEDGMLPYVDMLTEERTLKRPFLKAQGIADLIKRFVAGEERFPDPVAGMVWTLLNLEMFIRIIIEGDTVNDITR